MQIQLKSIDCPVRFHSPLDFEYSRLESTFTAKNFNGAAFFYISGALADADLERLRATILDRPIEVEASVEEISDFLEASSSEPEGVIPLGPRGEYVLNGQIVAHFETGGGSLFRANDVTLAIRVKMLPPGSLEVPPATHVRFRTKSFQLSFLRFAQT